MLNVNLDISGDIGVALEADQDSAKRALEIALDKTASDIRDGVVAEMKRVFDNPTKFTLDSLKVTRTKNHNMEASVWFKEPDRMEDHYLIPQVDGGPRKTKGFERALNDNMFIPGRGAKLNKHGNISQGQLRQILSVLGRAELTPGYQANITRKSSVRNKKARDYVFLPEGSRGGRLPPGIYERVAQKGSGFGGRAKKKMKKFGTYQKGARRRKFFSVIRARGLKPILLLGRQKKNIKPLLKFYEVSAQIQEDVFKDHFYAAFDEQLQK